MYFISIKRSILHCKKRICIFNIVLDPRFKTRACMPIDMFPAKTSLGEVGSHTSYPEESRPFGKVVKVSAYGLHGICDDVVHHQSYMGCRQ